MRPEVLLHFRHSGAVYPEDLRLRYFSEQSWFQRSPNPAFALYLRIVKQVGDVVAFILILSTLNQSSYLLPTLIVAFLTYRSSQEVSGSSIPSSSQIFLSFIVDPTQEKVGDSLSKHVHVLSEPLAFDDPKDAGATDL